MAQYFVSFNFHNGIGSFKLLEIVLQSPINLKYLPFTQF